MIPEALVHGALPWIPTDRLRRVLVLRYRPHGNGPVTNPQPKFVLSRLSPETVELSNSSAAEGGVKKVAKGWMEKDRSAAAAL